VSPTLSIHHLYLLVVSVSIWVVVVVVVVRCCRDTVLCRFLHSHLEQSETVDVLSPVLRYVVARSECLFLFLFFPFSKEEIFDVPSNAFIPIPVPLRLSFS